MGKTIYVRDASGKLTALDNVTVVSENAVERLQMRLACGFPAKGPLPAMPSSDAEASQWSREASNLSSVIALGEDALGKTGLKNLTSAQSRLVTGVQGFKVMAENGWSIDDFRAADDADEATDADTDEG